MSKEQKLAYGLFYEMHALGKNSCEAAKRFGLKESKAIDIMNKYPGQRQLILQDKTKEGGVA